MTFYTSNITVRDCCECFVYKWTQARSQAEAEEAAASSDLAQIDNVLIMCSHDITYHFNIWTLCHSLVKKTNL